MTRRLWIGAILTVPLLVLMSDARATPGCAGYSFALATPVCCGADGRFSTEPALGAQPQSEHVYSDRTRHGLGLPLQRVCAAVPQRFPRRFEAGAENRGLLRAGRHNHHAVLLGQVLELRARSRTSGAIRALLQLAPRTARVIRANGSEQDVPVGDIAAGDRIRVRPGEKVPWTVSSGGQKRGG